MTDIMSCFLEQIKKNELTSLQLTVKIKLKPEGSFQLNILL